MNPRSLSVYSRLDFVFREGQRPSARITQEETRSRERLLHVPAPLKAKGAALGPRKSKRDFSLRKPTASSRKTIRDAKSAQERSGKKKSACSVRNDGRAWAA